MRRARFEPSDIPPTDFVFLPFSLGGTEIFLRRCRGSRPEIGCRAIHHSGEFSREAHPSRMAACMRFPSTHTHARLLALGVWRRPRGVWGSLFCCLVSPQNARALVYVDAGPFCRRPNPSCTHAFLSRCFLVDAGSESAPKTVEEKELRDETEMENSTVPLKQQQQRAGRASRLYTATSARTSFFRGAPSP